MTSGDYYERNENYVNVSGEFGVPGHFIPTFRVT